MLLAFTMEVGAAAAATNAVERAVAAVETSADYVAAGIGLPPTAASSPCAPTLPISELCLGSASTTAALLDTPTSMTRLHSDWVRVHSCSLNGTCPHLCVRID